MTGIALFDKGGFIMYPLFIFSVLAWSLGSYKIFHILSFNKGYRKLNQELKDALLKNRHTDVSALLRDRHPLAARPLEAISSKTPKDVMNERVGRRLSETNAALKEHLWVLGSISASAPFIGLFGTVVGIMGSFEAIGTSGKTGFSVVAAGISESLVATAAGIIVAVVALLFYNFLQSKVNAAAVDFRLKAEELIDIVSSEEAR